MIKKNSYFVHTEHQSKVLREFDQNELDQFRAQNFGAKRNILIVPADLKPKAVFFDMDSTVVQQESIVELAKSAGKSEEVHLITEAAMEGKLDFVAALRQRVAVLKGIDESVFGTVFQSFTLNPGMAAFAADMRFCGVEFFLISGGFNRLAKPLAEKLKFTDFRANDLEVVEGKLTGALLGDIVDAQMKAQWVKDQCVMHRFSVRDIVVIGDGANDLDMMALSRCPIGINPKPVLWPKVMGTVVDFDFVRQALFPL